MYRLDVMRNIHIHAHIYTLLYSMSTSDTTGIFHATGMSLLQDVRMLSTDVCVPLRNFSLLIEQTEQDYEAQAAEGVPLKCNIFGR